MGLGQKVANIKNHTQINIIMKGMITIAEANYGGGVCPYNQDQYQQASDIDAFGKGTAKGKGKDTRSCWICGKQGHISRDCRSPKAAELRAQGVIGQQDWNKGKGKGKGGQWDWNKGKGKGKGKGKHKGVYEMEYDYMSLNPKIPLKMVEKYKL